MTPEWTGMNRNDTGMSRNDTGMNRNRQFLHMFKRTVLKKKNIVCIFFKSIWRGIKCAVTKTLLIILHSLTPSLPPMHPFCSESNNLGKGEGGQGMLNLW